MVVRGDMFLANKIRSGLFSEHVQYSTIADFQRFFVRVCGITDLLLPNTTKRHNLDLRCGVRYQNGSRMSTSRLVYDGLTNTLSRFFQNLLRLSVRTRPYRTGSTALNLFALPKFLCRHIFHKTGSTTYVIHLDQNLGINSA